MTISAYATAMFASWYFIEEYGLLFDAGDGLMAGLLQKSRKIEHVFISHPDRDHLTGLLQFNQLNAREGGKPRIYYPADSGSFPALEQFSKQFDPHVVASTWLPIRDGDKIWIREDMYVQALRNNHIPAAPGIDKSFGYKLVQVRRKLKPALAALSPDEIKTQIQNLGKEACTDATEQLLFAYSGDTPAENFEQWDGAAILVHEATFLGPSIDKTAPSHSAKHSTLDAVLSHLAPLQIGQLVLGHFSSRYSAELIDETIIKLCQVYEVHFPVYRILPGEVSRDILDQEPIYRP